MKRGHYRTEAIVLSTFDYGESDVIAALYTPGFGKLRGIAKGALRSRRRFVATLATPAHISLEFFSNGKSELVRLEDSRLVEGYREVRCDIERLTHASYLLELTDRMTREGETSEELFSLLEDFLLLACTSDDVATLVRFFEIKALKVLGYMPWLDGCVVCRGDNEGSAKIFFSSERGGLVCGRCAAGLVGLIPLTLGTAALLQAAAKLDTDKLTRLVAGPAFAEEADRALADFIRHHGGVEFKTRSFLDQLKNAGI